MKNSFGTAIGRALELTRTRKLGEATRVIQELLAGRSSDLPSGGAEPSGADFSVAAKRHLSEPGRQAATRPAPRRSSASPDASPRVRRPLREVLQLLRDEKRFAEPPLARGRRAVPAVADDAAFSTHSYTCAAGTRAYKLYVPDRGMGRRRPLLIMLHGCTQNPDDFAAGTRMNLHAEEHGFVVAYPEQSSNSNPSACWNWFNPGDQRRGAGEPSIIAGITQRVIEEHDIDPRQVFVAGLSAGGAMAAIMGATYPELYAAIGVHSGLSYGSAQDVVSAFAAMRGHAARSLPRPDARIGVRTIVFHGAADAKVHPANGGAVADAARAARDDSTYVVHDGRSAGRDFTRTVVKDAGGATYVEHWVIAGAGHAWSGGSPEGSYTDAQGPDASREMLRFFLEEGAGRPRA
jgi:poly(hydroxyalkanoate) depolymerase family esterase